MAYKAFHILSCIFLSLLLPVLSHPNTYGKLEIPASPFEFVKNLQGSQKGDNIKGLSELKKYLVHFGYLKYGESGVLKHADDNVFDNHLELAIKTYQLNYCLSPTGTLDIATVSKLMMPRCGVPDIINGTNWMRQPRLRLGSLRVVSRYNFPGPHWSPNKMHLTVGFQSSIPANVISIVMKAFAKWASVSHFTFSESRDFSHADLHISFLRGNHGDSGPFDGPGGILAHAGLPPDGNLHFDADERWSNGPVPGDIDMGSVALHEIGHLLGLGHSSVQQAIMYPTIPSGTSKGLNTDDIQGIKALYHWKLH